MNYYNPVKHHRRSIRLKGYDYSQPGDYYITLSTEDRACILGEIDNGVMRLNDIGQIVERTWKDLPNHNKNIALDVFVIMPNHFHGIIRIENEKGADSDGKADFGGRVDLEGRAGLEPAPTKGEKNHYLSEIIRQFKTFSTRYINERRNQQGTSIWQRNYFEHVIRSHEDLEKIREYIINNPKKWQEDRTDLESAPTPHINPVG